MRFGKAIIAALSLSIAATPALAQSAAPLSVAGAAHRSGADMDQSGNLAGNGFGEYGIAIAFFAVAIGLVFLLDDDDNPSSP